MPHPGIYANDCLRHGLSFSFLMYFLYSQAPCFVSVWYSKPALALSALSSGFKKPCCCTKACGLHYRSLRCSSCGSPVGALPYVRSWVLGRLCSACDKAKESISGGESTLGAVSGKEQIETVQRLLYIWHHQRIFYSPTLQVQQI